jgi:tetratricopeptide (TPR) repeat protein
MGEKTMRKMNLLLCVLVILPLLSGCRLKVRRLNKRIQKWESLQLKGATEQKAKFAKESLVFFLNTVDLQRSKEALVTESERLRYHSEMSSMQVFLIDYHAERALRLLDEGNQWEAAALEWARADSLTYGKIPEVSTIYSMVLLNKGYELHLQEISAEGFRYKREERQFPGLMQAFRKMSEYQCRLARHLESQGRLDEAVEHYLLVFRRDPQNYAEANRRLKHITGRVIREIYDDRYRQKVALANFTNIRMEMYGMVEQQLGSMRPTLGDSVDQALPAIMESLSEYYHESPERLMDVYLSTRSEREGTLHQYANLWRYQVLKGHPPLKPRFIE